MNHPFVLTLAVALMGAPVRGADQPRIAVLSIAASDPKLTPLADSIGEEVMTELGARHFETIGSSDLATMLGLERQKRLLNCDVQAECMAELSSALGAPWVISGKLTRAATVLRVDLKLLHAADGRVAWRGGREVTDEGKVYATVRAMIPDLVDALTPPTTNAPTRVAPLLVSGAGLVALLAGSGLAFFTWSGQRQYADPTFRWPASTPLSSVIAQQQSANTSIAAGLAIAGVGAAALITGLLWYFLGTPAETSR